MPNSPVEELIEHAQENHPHFENERGQQDILRAKKEHAALVALSVVAEELSNDSVFRADITPAQIKLVHRFREAIEKAIKENTAPSYRDENWRAAE